MKARTKIVLTSCSICAISVTGPTSGSADDAVSEAVCPDTHPTVVACECTPSGNCDGSEVTSDGVCKATNRYQKSGVQVSAPVSYLQYSLYDPGET